MTLKQPLTFRSGFEKLLGELAVFTHHTREMRQASLLTWTSEFLA